MDLFGIKFAFALGTWKLRFVCMLEDGEDSVAGVSAARAPHHITVRDPQTAGHRSR